MIEKAIEIENKYQNNRMNEIETLPLIDLLKPLGYDNIDSYFLDKIDYSLTNVGAVSYEGDMLGIPEAIAEAVRTATPTIFFPYASRKFIWHGNEEVDLELCNNLEIDILTLDYFGGNIVSGPEDFSMGFLVPKTIDVTFEYVLNRFANFYKKYFDDVIIDNNDILINGNKVQGSICFDGNGMFFYGTAISFVDRTNLIKKICKKQSTKIPGFIDSTILSKQVLVKEVKSWVH